jgi:hypothetical protein
MKFGSPILMEDRLSAAARPARWRCQVSADATPRKGEAGSDASCEAIAVVKASCDGFRPYIYIGIYIGMYTWIQSMQQTDDIYTCHVAARP